MGERLLMEFIGIDLVSKVAHQISSNVNKMAANAEKASVKTTSAWSKMGGFLKVGAIAAATVITTVGVSLAGFIERAVASGDAAHELAEKFGFTGSEASKWLSVMRQTGIDQETLTTSLRVMSTHVAANDKAFGGLGVNLKNAKGEMRSVNDILMDTISALSRMPAGAERSALVSHLFGRGGQALSSMLDEGPAKIQAMMKGGAAMTDEQVAAAHKLVMEWRQVKEQGIQLLTTIGTALMPVLANLLGWLLSTGIPGFVAFAKWIGAIAGPIIKGVIAFIGGVLIPAIKAIWIGVQPGVNQLLPAWRDLMKQLQPVIKAVTDFLFEHRAEIKQGIEIIGKLVGSTVIGLLIIQFKAAAIVVKGVATMVGDMVAVIKTAVGWVQTLAGAISKIKMPDVKLPSGFSLPHFATGGFVGTDMIAKLHAGEFVMPKVAVDAMGKGGGMSVMTQPTRAAAAGNSRTDDLLLKILNALTAQAGGTGMPRGNISQNDLLAVIGHLVERSQTQRNRGTRAGFAY